jgi:uncharacterized protein
MSLLPPQPPYGEPRRADVPGVFGLRQDAATMRIAVVGAGIAGLAAAHTLQQWAQVTLFEAQNRLGGHTDTHAILAGGRSYPVDSGFMAWDAARSPGFGAWLDELGVVAHSAELDLGIHHVPTGLEYCTRSVGALLCQPRNLGSPRFVNLLRELVRFYLTALPVADDDARPLSAFLDAHGFSRSFRELHLVPVCRALWSVDAGTALTLPAAEAVPRLVRQRLLPVGTRPEWRVIQGGARSYVDAFVSRFSGRICRGEAVRAISRPPGRVVVTTASGRQVFDAVVIACHSHEALALLEDPSREERQVLGSLRFETSRRVVHSDPRVMPRNRNAWAAWNARIGGPGSGRCEFTFWMNRLLSLPDHTPMFVTLDPEEPLDNVWSTREYSTPVLDDRARAAQRRYDDVSGLRNTWYCGAWWGDGMQEDGFSSGVAVAAALARAASEVPSARASG